ncbi:MAG TPA: hypothetical protein ENI44_04010 [Thermoplasmatales archaeon]|nr:hypothetical protein [Thermoplasmatales archaeon]
MLLDGFLSIKLPPIMPTYNALMKLRIIITTIFLLSTIAMILVFTRQILLAVLLFLISYLLVFILMIKLFLIKKL